MIGSRDINYYQPDQIKRVRILNRADGYYVQFCLKLDPRDRVKPLTPSQKATGIDVGLKFFLVDSEGHQIDCPNYYRKAEKQRLFVTCYGSIGGHKSTKSLYGKRLN